MGRVGFWLGSGWTLAICAKCHSPPLCPRTSGLRRPGRQRISRAPNGCVPNTYCRGTPRLRSRQSLSTCWLAELAVPGLRADVLADPAQLVQS